MLLPRRAVLGGMVLGFAGLSPAMAADQAVVDRLISTLRTSKSYKVRMHAAALLAREDQPQVFDVLAQASYGDPDEAVRSVVVRLLAMNPGGDAAGNHARQFITRAMRGDPSPRVRTSARQAMTLLTKNLRSARQQPRPAPVQAQSMPVSIVGAPAPVVTGRLTISVGRIGGSASGAVRERMRDEVRGQLRRSGRVSVLEDGTPGAIYVLDGTIRKLQLERRSREVEATASVDLVLSKPPRGIMLVASGEAVVQKSERYLAGNLRDQIMAEAVEHAVGSAHENLLAYFARL